MYFFPLSNRFVTQYLKEWDNLEIMKINFKPTFQIIHKINLI